MTAALDAPKLRADAQALGHALPALVAQAQHLASALNFGAHGRKRAGAGDEFWQYRPAQAGDSAAAIDWRRSARGDTAFVREREWQALNTVSIWLDTAQSMQFSSAAALPTKGARAQLLALALAVSLLRGGERVGLIGGAPPKSGRGHLAHLMSDMIRQSQSDDYGQAPQDTVAPGGRAVYLSDFLGPIDPLMLAITRAADRGVQGALVQVLDSAEQEFPFAGRVIFQSMGGSLRHETHSASDLRARYLQRLAEREDALRSAAQRYGWAYLRHATDQPPLAPLIWLHNTLSGAAA